MIRGSMQGQKTLLFGSPLPLFPFFEETELLPLPLFKPPHNTSYTPHRLLPETASNHMEYHYQTPINDKKIWVIAIDADEKRSLR